jgi:prepilin signal peptidase PulO-like enzyme (type II secretory pathway)
VEIISAAIFCFAYWYTGTPILAILLALALWLLFVMAVIDAKTHTIADMLNFPFVFISLAYGFLSGGLDLIAPCIGAGFFALLWGMSRGKWIGSGDIFLGAGIGALVGAWQMMVASLMVTYVLGALIVSIMLVTKKVTRKSYVAFAPFLFLGTITTLLLERYIQQVLWLYF